jgi:hypothetical protein
VDEAGHILLLHGAILPGVEQAQLDACDEQALRVQHGRHLRSVFRSVRGSADSPGGYIVIVVLTYLYHISYLSESGFCVIGIHQKVSFALSAYEIAINVYLTSLFLYPLRNIYSYKTHTSPQLKQMTARCVIGTLGTLASTGANLFAISSLDGEPAWLCLLCCNLDRKFFDGRPARANHVVLFCVMIVHYVTSFRADKELATKPDCKHHHQPLFLLTLRQPGSRKPATGRPSRRPSSTTGRPASTTRAASPSRWSTCSSSTTGRRPLTPRAAPRTAAPASRRSRTRVCTPRRSLPPGLRRPRSASSSEATL